MKERPILFSAPMVRAILDGKKTQTRRIIKSEPKVVHALYADGTLETEQIFRNPDYRVRCPYGAVGDRLWVKETHFLYGKWVKNGTSKTGKQKWRFMALKPRGVMFPDNPPEQVETRREVSGWFKRPSIFMPRWASRITLELTDVRVERLQDISREDCIAEGIDAAHFYPGISDTEGFLFTSDCSCGAWMGSCRSGAPDGIDPFGSCPEVPVVEKYRELWNSINGAGAWEKNPWCWALTFERVKP